MKYSDIIKKITADEATKRSAIEKCTAENLRRAEAKLCNSGEKAKRKLSIKHIIATTAVAVFVGVILGAIGVIPLNFNKSSMLMVGFDSKWGSDTTPKVALASSKNVFSKDNVTLDIFFGHILGFTPENVSSNVEVELSFCSIAYDKNKRFDRQNSAIEVFMQISGKEFASEQYACSWNESKKAYDFQYSQAVTLSRELFEGAYGSIGINISYNHFKIIVMPNGLATPNGLLVTSTGFEIDYSILAPLYTPYYLYYKVVGNTVTLSDEPLWDSPPEYDIPTFNIPEIEKPSENHSYYLSYLRRTTIGTYKCIVEFYTTSEELIKNLENLYNDSQLALWFRYMTISKYQKGTEYYIDQIQYGLIYEGEVVALQSQRYIYYSSGQWSFGKELPKLD